MRIWRAIWSRKWCRWGLIAFTAFAIFNVVAVEVTSKSWFCNSCHIMGTFYQSWKASTHKDVPCVQCHIPPGLGNYAWAKLNGAGQVVDDLLHRTSTKPSANVEDAACTRSGCHDLEQVRATKVTGGKFKFDHGKHLGRAHQGIDIHCTTCHSHYQGSKHFEVNANVCITCHLLEPGEEGQGPRAKGQGLKAEGKAPGAAVVQVSHGAAPPAAPGPAGTDAPPPRACKHCHDAPDRPLEYRGLKVVHAEYLAYGAACESCHRNVTARPEKIREDKCFTCHDFGLETVTSIPKLHHVHATAHHKVECFHCHGLVRHGPKAQAMRLEQFDCQSCHHQQHQVQRLTYTSVAGHAQTRPAPTAATATAHQVADSVAVSPMFMAHVECTGCHVQERELRSKPGGLATVAVASAKACDACHKPGLGEQMIPMWQKNTRQLYDLAQGLLPPDGLAGQPARSSQAQQLIKEGRQLLELVRTDGSWGVHNPIYTQRLLEQAAAKLAEAQGKPAPTTAPAQGGGK